MEKARAIQAQGPRETRAGDLQWTAQTVNGRVVSVRRTLTVGLFGSREELVLILAHELGHALGIGHVPAEGAVMAETYRQDHFAPPVRLSAADRAALARQCELPGS